MNSACKISVIIPVHNMAQYLDDTVASWTTQTLKDIEIICVDDGSTDNSLQKLQESAGRDSRIHVYSLPENKSAWCARNLGIEKACGEYMLFADADDTVLPETCEELALAMDETQVDILQYPIEVLNANGLLSEQNIADVERVLTPYKGELYGKDILTTCFKERKYCWNLAGKIFKTKICKNILSDIILTGIQNKYMLTAEDGLLYFMLSYTAQSYIGMQCKKYYKYYLGRGGLGKDFYTVQYFKKFCMQSQISTYMKYFLELHNELDKDENIIHIIRDVLLTDIMYPWINNIRDIDKPQAFDLMLCYWKPDEVIGKMANLCFNERRTIAKQLQGAATLVYDRHSIKTIAVYFHSITNDKFEQILGQLSKIWTDMGYRIIILSDKEPSGENFQIDSNIEVLAIPDLGNTTQQTYGKRASLLRKIIIDHHIDAVVHYGFLDPFLFWDALVIKTAGAAFLIHRLGIFSSNLIHNYIKYDYILSPFLLADACITDNKPSYEFWKYYNPNVHVSIPPLIYDLSKQIPMPFAASHKILWTGDLSAQKDLDLIAIMQEVVKHVPDAVLTVLTGNEAEDSASRLKEQIAEHRLEGHIVYAGFQRHVIPWYLSSQIALMTSGYEEYPMTLLNSKTAGIPCVMYELPYQDLCENNRGVIAVPQGDTQAAARSIIKLLQNDTLCARYGRDARKHIEELACFDFKGKWQQVFESIGHSHKAVVSASEKMMMHTVIAQHERDLQDTQKIHDREIQQLRQELDSRNNEIQQLRHGNYIRRVVRAVVPNRVKPYIKAILHSIPQSIKDPFKRLMRW